MLETIFLMWQLLSHRVTPPPRILVVELCILILCQFIQHVPQFVNYANTGYQPVNEDYVPSSVYPSQGYLSDRPLCPRELAELLMHSRKDHLPEWKIAQFDGNPLNWHERFGQFKSTVGSAVCTDDTKLTFLKTLVTGKAKTAIAELSYSGVMYEDALAILQRKFGQPHAFVGAHIDKLSIFPPLKIHNPEKVISFSSAISGLVAVSSFQITVIQQ